MAGVKNTGRRAAGWIAAICIAFSGCAAAAGETTGGEIFVSERISHNYTKVSAGYTLPVYTGDDIPLAVDESVTDVGGAEWTDEMMGYAGAAKVLRVRYGNTVVLNADIPADGQYAVRLDYYSYNPGADENQQTTAAWTSSRCWTTTQLWR